LVQAIMQAQVRGKIPIFKSTSRLSIGRRAAGPRRVTHPYLGRIWENNHNNTLIDTDPVTSIASPSPNGAPVRCLSFPIKGTNPTKYKSAVRAPKLRCLMSSSIHIHIDPYTYPNSGIELSTELIRYSIKIVLQSFSYYLAMIADR
jgi:hypothetical protein